MEASNHKFLIKNNEFEFSPSVFAFGNDLSQLGWVPHSDYWWRCFPWEQAPGRDREGRRRDLEYQWLLLVLGVLQVEFHQRLGWHHEHCFLRETALKDEFRCPWGEGMGWRTILTCCFDQLKILGCIWSRRNPHGNTAFRLWYLRNAYLTLTLVMKTYLINVWSLESSATWADRWCLVLSCQRRHVCSTSEVVLDTSSDKSRLIFPDRRFCATGHRIVFTKYLFWTSREVCRRVLNQQ